MADRGRKAFPVSSHLCDEKWQRHCMDLHKQRLADMKHRIDNTKPETFDLVLSKGKRHMLDKERQTEVDRENAILLQKMVRIKEQDTRAVFRPWTARSTFQWRPGHYYDAATNTKTLDHINLTSSVSPRSIHYFALTRPGTAPPDVTARLRDMEIQVDNTKLLRAITTMRTHYSNEVFERRHAEESVLVQRISNFRGPEDARYNPPGRSASAARSPYLASPSGRGSSSTSRARPAPQPLPTLSPSGLGQGSGDNMQRYYEDAQTRDLPYVRSNSRPGTAIAGPRGSTEGLGATSPPPGVSRQGSLSGGSAAGDAARRASGSAAGSRPGSASAASGAAGATGKSFTFGMQQEAAGLEQEQRPGSSEERRASSVSQRSGSGAGAAAAEDDYGDEQYEDDEPAAEEARAPASASASAKGSDEEHQAAQQEASEKARSSDAGEDGADAGGNSYEDEGFEQEAAAEQEPSRGSASGADEEQEGRPRDSYGGDEAPAEAEASSGEGGAAESERGAGNDASGEFRAERSSEAGAKSAASVAAKEDSHFTDDDAEAKLRKEMAAAEEAEMNQQFEAEMAADMGGDEYGYYGGEPAPDAKSLGGLSYNTTASPKVGAFAADWD